MKTRDKQIADCPIKFNEVDYEVKTQSAINQILQISMEPIEFAEQLDKILQIILSLSWFVIESKGAIQLVDADTNCLVFGATYGLSEAVLSACSKVPFGTCICGQAAAKREIVFTSNVNEQHSIHPDGMTDHGHYCMPIMDKQNLIGILNLYVGTGHLRTAEEEEFLDSVAHTLAGLIVRKRYEEELEKSNAILEQGVKERTLELEEANFSLINEMKQRKQAEEIALESSRVWEETFNSIEDLISIQSVDCRLIRVNKAYANLFEANPEDLIGKHCYEIVHQTKCQHIHCPHTETLELKQAVTREIFEPLLNAYLEITTTPLFDKDAKCLGTVHIAKNITERVKAQEQVQASEAHLASTLNSIGDAVISTDLNGVINRVNPAAESLTGLCATDILGKPIDSILHIVSEKSRKRIVKPVEKVIALGTTISFSDQTLLIRKDGQRRYLDETGSPILDEMGRMTGVVFALRDITEERELDLMKEQFMQTISHELRTPLSSIIGYQDLLLSEAMGPVNEAQRQMLDISMKNSEALLELINDMLDLSRLESGKMQVKFSPVKIQAVIDEIVKSFRPQILEKKLSIDVECVDEVNPEFISDERKLKHIIRNLVGNSVKFTENGSIGVKIEQKEDKIRLTVQDTGIGIPVEAQEYIFERFRQVDNSMSRKVDGSGLGLPIVKKMTELLGGNIALDSEVGVGSTFTVELPLEPQAVSAEV